MSAMTFENYCYWLALEKLGIDHTTWQRMLAEWMAA